MKKKALSILLVLLLTLTACVTAAATPEASIQSLDLERGADTAQVSLTVDAENTLLVAVYDVDQKMVALGARPVTPGESTVSVALTAPVPQLFRAEAFLLNDAQAPACESLSLDRSAETPTPPAPTTRTLVAYFSATGTTEGVAEKLAAALGDKADLYEIVPEVPYTSADLNYNTDCRANREQNDANARPEIASTSTVSNMEDYDVIFLGYPIWWGQAPKIMYTFLESYDFNGKTIVPFCTSGSSGIGSSATNLAAVTSGATWLPGQRVTSTTVQSWVNGLNLNLS